MAAVLASSTQGEEAEQGKVPVVCGQWGMGPGHWTSTSSSAFGKGDSGKGAWF